MNRRKMILTACVFSVGACLLIAATFSWFTKTQAMTNNFESTHLKTIIIEDFTPEVNWQVDSTVVKDVRITNTGKGAAVVRASLSEFLMTFDISPEGPPVTLELGSMTVADLENPEQWDAADNLAVRAKYHDGAEMVDYDDKNGNAMYYHVKEILSSINFHTSTDPADPYPRNKNIDKYIKIYWNSCVGTDWIYNEQDGYFYYMHVLKSGEATKPLMDSVELLGTAPNAYQFAPYRILVQHDSVTAIKGVLEGRWNLDPSSSIYLGLNPLLPDSN